ncbi:MAG: MATE family efflux transporter [Eubacteriales bacterium]|nr:MATE family efflux transporter [Eubacteriales bacterium]
MKRNDAIIFRKFVHIMIPAFGTAIAVSLNEFVDSILVSQLLGSKAMAIVNVCSPVMLFAACLYLLFGIGGSIIYARLIGEKKEKDAEKIFSLALFSAFVISMIVMVLGIFFRVPFAALLAGSSDFKAELYPYLFYAFLSFPFIVVVMTISSFLPAMNYPVLASGCAILANVVNLIMDYVFIKLLHQGTCGAAMATLCGYVVTGILIVILFARKMVDVKLSNPFHDLSKESILEILKLGFADASIQLGFALTWGFRNNMQLVLETMNWSHSPSSCS